MQLAEFLASFSFPTGYREQFVSLFREAQRERDNSELRRLQIESRFGRMREMYQWGYIKRCTSQRERDTLLAQLSALEGGTDQPTVFERVAAFLMDLPVGWSAAYQEQRTL